MPDRPQKVVVNTSPIIALALLDQLDLLRRMYARVIVPSAVRAEVLAGGPGRPGATELQEAAWLEAMPLQDPGRADLLADLDRGEAEVIALALELNADLIVVDERLARRHASRLGLPLTGTLGVLLKAKHLNLVAAVAPLIRRLQHGGIHLRDDVIAEVLALANET